MSDLEKPIGKMPSDFPRSMPVLVTQVSALGLATTGIAIALVRIFL
jgi:hypothetical protein